MKRYHHHSLEIIQYTSYKIPHYGPKCGIKVSGLVSASPSSWIGFGIASTTNGAAGRTGYTVRARIVNNSSSTFMRFLSVAPFASLRRAQQAAIQAAKTYLIAEASIRLSIHPSIPRHVIKLILLTHRVLVCMCRTHAYLHMFIQQVACHIPPLCRPGMLEPLQSKPL